MTDHQKVFYPDKLTQLQSSYGQTPLMLAIFTGSYEMVKDTLDLTSDLDLQDVDGNTAFIHSIAHDYTISSLILSRNPNIHLRNRNNHTALSVAAALNRRQILKDLLKTNHHPTDWKLAFSFALTKENFEIAKILLESNSNRINNPDANGYSSLANAFAAGNERIVDFLLSSGASVEVPWIPKKLPKNPKILRKVLERGANPNWWIKTAIKMFCLESISLLVEYGVQPTSKMVEFAQKSRKTEIMKFLLMTGASPNIQTVTPQLDEELLNRFRKPDLDNFFGETLAMALRKDRLGGSLDRFFGYSDEHMRLYRWMKKYWFRRRPNVFVGSLKRFAIEIVIERGFQRFLPQTLHLISKPACNLVEVEVEV